MFVRTQTNGDRSYLLVVENVRVNGRIKQRILLAPHLDTVPGASDAQYVPRLHGGRGRTRLAALMTAVE